MLSTLFEKSTFYIDDSISFLREKLSKLKKTVFTRTLNSTEGGGEKQERSKSSQ